MYLQEMPHNLYCSSDAYHGHMRIHNVAHWYMCHSPLFSPVVLRLLFWLHGRTDSLRSCRRLRLGGILAVFMLESEECLAVGTTTLLLRTCKQTCLSASGVPKRGTRSIHSSIVSTFNHPPPLPTPPTCNTHDSKNSPARIAGLLTSSAVRYHWSKDPCTVKKLAGLGLAKASVLTCSLILLVNG